MPADVTARGVAARTVRTGTHVEVCAVVSEVVDGGVSTTMAAMVTSIGVVGSVDVVHGCGEAATLARIAIRISKTVLGAAVDLITLTTGHVAETAD